MKVSRKNYTYDEKTGILRISGMEENPVICASPLMQEVVKKAVIISQEKDNVLITGETGVGKGLIAKAIHYLGGNSGDFTKINCSSFVENLFESEIFGYVPGAFTGATKNKIGVFSSIGTVLLDEIADISLRSQNSLRSAIEDREFRKVGHSNGNPQKLEARIIAATNLDLEKAISKKMFKEDLYYRLNVLEINIPPLRERKQDILVLKDIFLKKYCEVMKREVGLDKSAISELINYPFPGNVRELENLIQRAVAMTEHGKEYKSFERDFRKRNKKEIKGGIYSFEDYLSGKVTLQEELDNIKRTRIIDALKHTDFVKTKASKVLGIDRSILHYRIKKLRIDVRGY